jgi:hypothetical protein
MAGLIEIKTDWKNLPTTRQGLAQVHDYWKSRCGQAACPSRQSIQPRDLSKLIRYVFLVDAEPDGDFRFRLAGGNFTDATGIAMANRRMGEVFPALFCAEVRDAWRYAATQVSPVMG